MRAGPAVLLGGCVLITPSERDVQALHWVDVAVTSESTCAVRTDGTLRCWADDDVTDWAAEVPPGDGFVAVDAGLRHACALGDDGAVVCFGNGIVFGDDRHERERAGPHAWVDAGIDKTCAGFDDGTFECWGSEANWSNGAPTGPVDAFSVWYGGCAVEAGAAAVGCWGENGRAPVLPADVVPVALSMGLDSTLCAVDEDGAVYCGSLSYDSDGTLVRVADGMARIEAVADEMACGLSTSGEVACFGEQVHDALAEPPGGAWVDLAASVTVGCLVAADGRLGCWGDRSDPRFPR